MFVCIYILFLYTVRRNFGGVVCGCLLLLFILLRHLRHFPFYTVKTFKALLLLMLSSTDNKSALQMILLLNRAFYINSLDRKICEAKGFPSLDELLEWFGVENMCLSLIFHRLL